MRSSGESTEELMKDLDEEQIKRKSSEEFGSCNPRGRRKTERNQPWELKDVWRITRCGQCCKCCRDSKWKERPYGRRVQPEEGFGALEKESTISEGSERLMPVSGLEVNGSRKCGKNMNAENF